MGWYLIRGALLLKGGSAQIGADVNIYRGAANRLHTDDGLQVGGTANLTGATRIGGAASLAGGVAASPGTPYCVPHGTASPTITTNGDIRVYTKSDVNYLITRINGTVVAMAFPNATHGTPTFTIGGTP